MREAYTPGLQRSYYNIFHVLLLFSFHYQLDIQSFNVNNAICFIQCLVDSGLSTLTIHTYLSAIKSNLSSFGIDNSIWLCHRVLLMLKTCSETVAGFNQPKHVLTPRTLTDFINRLSFYPEGCLFKALFL